MIQLLLHAGRPLHGVWRMELLGQHDKLRLMREGGGGRRLERQRKRVSWRAAVGPRTAETHRNTHRNIRDGCGERWVLVHSLSGEEVRFVIDQRRTSAEHSFTLARRIKGDSNARRELPRRVLGKCIGHPSIPMVKASRRSV